MNPGGLCLSLMNRVGSSGGMSVTASPAGVDALGSGSTTTPPIMATPSGGVAPYTYAWTYQGGDPTVAIDSPATAATTFTATVTGGDNKLAFFVCTVTDSGALSAQSNQVTATISGN